MHLQQDCASAACRSAHGTGYEATNIMSLHIEIAVALGWDICVCISNYRRSGSGGFKPEVFYVDLKCMTRGTRRSVSSINKDSYLKMASSSAPSTASAPRAPRAVKKETFFGPRTILDEELGLFDQYKVW